MNELSRGSVAGVPTRRRRRRRRHRSSWRRHPLRSGLLVAAGVLLLATGWLLARGLAARAQLLAARTELAYLRADLLAGDSVTAEQALSSVQVEVANADHDTHDPVWAAAAALPMIGNDVAVVRDLARTLDHLVAGPLPRLVGLAASVSPARLRVSGSTINIELLARSAPMLNAIDIQLHALAGSVAGSPSSFLVPPVARARALVVDQLASLAGSVDDATRFANAAPTALGATGLRRYFLALENPAESRGTGGLVGAFAILTADHGRLHLAQVGSDTELVNAASPVASFGPGFAGLYGGFQATQSWKSANDTPDFPQAATIWARLWQRQSGEPVAGVIGVEPAALADLLAVTGPLHVDGQYVDAANAASYLEAGVYARFGRLDQQGLRKRLLVTIESAAFTRVLAGVGSAQGLAAALGHAAAAGALRFWSADPAVEAQVAPTPLSGAVPDTAAPYDLVSVVNDGGDKLDYYLHRALVWTAGGCRGADRTATVTVALTNAAPPGLPAYVTVRVDTPVRAHPYAQTRLLVSIWATRGAQLLGTTLNGAPSTVALGSDLGHPVFTADLEINDDQTAVLSLRLREPVAGGLPELGVQPLVNPLRARVQVPACG